ncbi:hypothetical protein A2U01_0052828, partial [Trifolium medium]|nr:hypothetical protein [Trifolium medium]
RASAVAGSTIPLVFQVAAAKICPSASRLCYCLAYVDCPIATVLQ